MHAKNLDTNLRTHFLIHWAFSLSFPMAKMATNPQKYAKGGRPTPAATREFARQMGDPLGGRLAMGWEGYLWELAPAARLVPCSVTSIFVGLVARAQSQIITSKLLHCSLATAIKWLGQH